MGADSGRGRSRLLSLCTGREVEETLALAQTLLLVVSIRAHEEGHTVMATATAWTSMMLRGWQANVETTCYATNDDTYDPEATPLSAPQHLPDCLKRGSRP